MNSCRPSSRCIGILTLVILLAGCTAQWRQFEAQRLAAAGKTEEAISKLEEASAADPRNATIRRDLINRRSEAIEHTLNQAQLSLKEGEYDKAARNYRHALRLDANLSRAQSGLDEIEQTRHLEALNQKAQKALGDGRRTEASALANKIIAEHPEDKQAKQLLRQLDAETVGTLTVPQTLNAIYAKPISLEFRDVPIQQVFEALARTTHINFVLDKDVRPDLRASLFLRQTQLEDAVNLLLSTNRLEKKILNEKSILVYPADPAKTKEYQDLVIRAFYLDHADAKQLASTLKTLLKVREAIPDEKLNMILLRDTPEAIALAERVVALHEIPDAEVMLEVEVLEVTRTKLMELGLQWPAQASFTPLSVAGNLTTTLADLKHVNDSRIQVATGSITAKLNKTDSDVNLLANPRIRVRNKTKAKILIGDKVPIISTTSTATGFVSEAVQYVDVGLKLDVEPRVTMSDDVSIKIGLEVSSLVKEIRSSGGTLAYQIGTRNADTLLNLKDGETQILAGLLNDEERSSGNRLPVIGDLPLVGRLFGSQKDERTKTEIILSITPRIVQAAKRPTLAAAQFWSGSETTLRTRPLALPSVSKTAPATADGKQQTSAEPVATLASPQAQSLTASDISLSWKAPESAKPGETLTVSLQIKTDGPIRALPFQIGFDPLAVDIIKVEDGGFFTNETGQAGLSSNVDASTGKLFGSLTRNTVDGATGEGSVVILTLRPKTSKPVELRLLDATPINLGSQVLTPKLPPPLSLSIQP